MITEDKLTKFSEFVHLHVHTFYSLLDGGHSPLSLIKRAKELGQTAIAITDHGNFSGGIDFYETCLKEGIKPILGEEFYFTYDIDEPIENYEANGWDKKNYHLIVLAKNKTGYKNLLKLSSIAAVKGRYNGGNRIDFNYLEKYKEGLIVSSACLAGIIQARIQDWYIASNNPIDYLNKKLGKKNAIDISKKMPKKKKKELDDMINAVKPEEFLETAYEYAKRFKEMFGEDFYLELQTNIEPMQEIVNLKLIEIAQKLGIELIVTCDVHYTRKEDWDFHDSLICLSTKVTKSQEKRMRYKPCYHLMSEDEVRDYTSYLPKEVIDKAIANTNKIADQCNVKIEFGRIPFPDPGIPKDTTPDKYIRELAYKGLWKYAIHNEINIDEYIEKLEYELEVIKNAGFSEYFLVVKDYVDAANNKCNCLTGPGRGSAAGSLVTFFLNITKNIDPIKNGLLFSRFLNPERIEYPDCIAV